jgi:hypothetical protein
MACLVLEIDQIGAGVSPEQLAVECSEAKLGGMRRILEQPKRLLEALPEVAVPVLELMIEFGAISPVLHDHGLCLIAVAHQRRSRPCSGRCPLSKTCSFATVGGLFT